MGTLDDFLSGGEQPVVAEEEATETPQAAEAEASEAAAEEPKGPVRDEKGRFAPKGEQEAAPPAAEEQPNIPVKALQEERRKRQELEAKLAELESKLNPPPPPPSIWEDEQGFGDHITETATQRAVQQATFNARLDMSEMMVRQAHPDFEEKKATFLQLMNETPGLQQKALADPHPWNFAYNYVTTHQRMQEVSATSIDDLKAKLREEIKAELAAAPKAETPPIPDTLADAQSAKGGSTAPLHVPSFEEILKR